MTTAFEDPKVTSELPADVVGPAMQAAQMIVTDEVRGSAGFAAVVPVGDDASASDRFAAFLGRRP